jgi:hypothetical protein
MNTDDHIAQTIIKQKLELVRKILVELGERHNFHFAINYSLLAQDSHRLIMNEGFVNTNIRFELLELFVAPLQILLQQQLNEINTIAIGKVVVACTNDCEQDPRLIDRVVVHEHYVVKHIHVEQSQHYYVLEGMQLGDAPGYEAARFVILFNNFNAN